jgi:hypothetical protein
LHLVACVGFGIHDVETSGSDDPQPYISRELGNNRTVSFLLKVPTIGRDVVLIVVSFIFKKSSV